MEPFFNPGLPEGGYPEIQLCIFPHLREFLVFDARGAEPQVQLLGTDDVFSEDFFRMVEAEFSQALRETGEFPFSHLMNLPMHLEDTIRDIAMTVILERLGVAMDDEDLPGVVVYVVSGGALSIHSDLVLEGLKELLHSHFSDAVAAQWDGKITEMVADEKTILEKINRQQLSEAMRGDSPDYFTLWESRN